jgi:predicted transcriptional regulator YdeE
VFDMSDTKVYDNDNPRIVSRGELLAAGLEYVGRNESFEIPQVWEQFTRRLSELEALRAPNGLVLGIAKEGPEPGVYDYLAAVEVTTLVGLPEGMAGWVIPAQDYAVFRVDNLRNIRSVMSAAHGLWGSKSSEWAIREGLLLEVYPEGFPDNPEMWLWLPVEKR